MRFEPVIGLEVHVHLATASKLFCACPTTFGVEPNSNVCEVCSGMPGVLPVLNEKAVEFAVRMGFAVGCTINDRSVFARKNYFYPDLPKGYQISQFERPICEHGFIDIEVDGTTKRIGITRIHLEDDAGKNIHSAADNASFVDLNRAGVPLIEIVSEPDMRSAAEAVAYLKALHELVVHLGISDGNMEEGSFRCDANVSIRPFGTERFGTRAELKNLNSFRHVQKAIEYEIARQQDVIEDGQSVVQETRLYDSAKNITMSMRGKEEAHDYRYFPDPDLVPVRVTDENMATWKASLPELPAAKRKRYVAEYGLSTDDVETLLSDPIVTAFFEEAAALVDSPALLRRVATLVLGPLLRECNQGGTSLASIAMKPQHLASLAELIEGGTISNKIAHDMFGDLFATGVDPKEHVRDKGLAQVSDTGAIDAIVAEVLAENPNEAEAYRGGKTKLQSFFVGQVMRKMRGKANPAMVNEALGRLLGN